MPVDDGIQRSPALQAVVNKMFEKLGITQDFADASNHPYTCKCDICLQWWVSMGPEYDEDNNPTYGPFSQEEYLAAVKAREDAEGDG